MRPGKRLDPRRVRNEMEGRSEVVAARLAASSAVPAEVIGRAEPAIEDELLDDVLQLVLNEFQHQPHLDPDEGVIPIPVDERVGSPDIEKFLTELLDAEKPAAPELGKGLSCERFWILLDLACNGPGLSRQRATYELRRTMHDLCRSHNIEIETLASLRDQLEKTVPTSGGALFTALKHSATRSLQGLLRQERVG